MEERNRQMVRTAAALFGAASVITFISVVAPHQPQLEAGSLVFVAVGAAVVTAVLLIDVDDFKEINDHHGHAAGDAALVQLAAALRHELRELDAVARIGGDEFAVLLPATGMSGAEATAARLRERSDVPISIGIAVYGVHGHSIDELARAADAALYEVKRGRVEPRASAVR